MKTIFTMLLSVLTLVIPNKSYPFTPSMMLLLEIMIIGLPSFFLSLQANDNRVDGKFIHFVIGKSVPGALLMLFSVLIIQLAQTLLAFEGVDDQIYIALQVYALTFAGLIMLYRICQPFNVFRATLFSVVTLIIVLWTAFGCAYGSGILNLSAITPLSDYWQHILIVVCIVLLDIPLSSVLQVVTEKLRLQPKRIKKSNH